MKIGFTGTRHGMTMPQKRALTNLLITQRSRGVQIWFEHGDCVGADQQAHAVFKLVFGGRGLVSIRPSNRPEMRAHCRGAEVVHTPDAPLRRNVLIVQHCDMLIACPAEYEEQSRGGTWYTVRQARRQGKPYTIIYPDGRTSEDGGQ